MSLQISKYRAVVVSLVLCALATVGMKVSYAAKVTKLSADDYIAIQQLYANYAHALDTGQAERFVDTFVEGGEFTGGRAPGHANDVRTPTTGREALLEMGGRGGTRHFVANLVITPTADGVKGSCYLLLFNVRQIPATILETAIYDDTLVKTSKGWKFSKRIVWRDDDDISPFKPKPLAADDAALPPATTTKTTPKPKSIADEPKVRDAGPNDVRVMATGAIREPLEAVVAQAQQAIGKPIFIEYGSARGNLKEEVLAGQTFEVALLLPDVDEQLRAQGHLASGSDEIARVNVAIGLRGNVPAPDISTAAALKRTLLQAKSVKYAPTGAALLTVHKVLDTLDIGAAIHDSSKLSEDVPLDAGEYEICFYPLSEILADPSLRNLGPVIPALQVPSVIEAVVGTHARDEQVARQLIRFLQGPAIDAALGKAGMVKGESHP